MRLEKLPEGELFGEMQFRGHFFDAFVRLGQQQLGIDDSHFSNPLGWCLAGLFFDDAGDVVSCSVQGENK